MAKQGTPVLIQFNEKTFALQMEKMLEKGSDGTAEVNYFMKDRIRSTVIFAGNPKELKEKALKIKKILDQDQRVVSVSSTPLLNDGYKQEKGYKNVK